MLSISPSAWYKSTQGNNLFWLVLESVVHVSRKNKIAGVWGFFLISEWCGNHRNSMVGCRSGLKPSRAILSHTFYPTRPHLKVSWHNNSSIWGPMVQLYKPVEIFHMLIRVLYLLYFIIDSKGFQYPLILIHPTKNEAESIQLISRWVQQEDSWDT